MYVCMYVRRDWKPVNTESQVAGALVGMNAFHSSMCVGLGSHKWEGLALVMDRFRCAMCGGRVGCLTLCLCHPYVAAWRGCIVIGNLL
jgi:hypothetical protein